MSDSENSYPTFTPSNRHAFYPRFDALDPTPGADVSLVDDTIRITIGPVHIEDIPLSRVVRMRVKGGYIATFLRLTKPSRTIRLSGLLDTDAYRDFVRKLAVRLLRRDGVKIYTGYAWPWTLFLNALTGGAAIAFTGTIILSDIAYPWIGMLVELILVSLAIFVAKKTHYLKRVRTAADIERGLEYWDESWSRGSGFYWDGGDGGGDGGGGGD